VRLHSAAGLLLLLLLESLVRSIEQKSAGSHPNIQSKESPSPFGCSLRLAFWPSIRRRSFEPTPPFLRRFVLAFNFFFLFPGVSLNLRRAWQTFQIGIFQRFAYKDGACSLASVARCVGSISCVPRGNLPFLRLRVRQAVSRSGAHKACLRR
jgi:hypothetical protein